MTHGTRSGYNHGCRCDPCRAAARAYAADRRRAAFDRRIIDIDLREVARVPRDRHGRIGTYTNHGCRCEQCTQAKRLYDRRHAAGASREGSEAS